MLPETKKLKLKFNYIYILQQLTMLGGQIPLKVIIQISVKINHQ